MSSSLLLPSHTLSNNKVEIPFNDTDKTVTMCYDTDYGKYTYSKFRIEYNNVHLKEKHKFISIAEKYVGKSCQSYQQLKSFHNMVKSYGEMFNDNEHFYDDHLGYIPSIIADSINYLVHTKVPYEKFSVVDSKLYIEDYDTTKLNEYISGNPSVMFRLLSFIIDSRLIERKVTYEKVIMMNTFLESIEKGLSKQYNDIDKLELFNNDAFVQIILQKSKNTFSKLLQALQLI